MYSKNSENQQNLTDEKGYINSSVQVSSSAYAVLQILLILHYCMPELDLDGEITQMLEYLSHVDPCYLTPLGPISSLG